MHTRENARAAAKLTKFITDTAATYVDFFVQAGLNQSEASRVIHCMQNTFLYYTENEIDIVRYEECPEEIFIIAEILNQVEIRHQFAEIVTKILQEAYKSFRCRIELENKLLGGDLDWRIIARNARNLFRRWDDYEAADRAATLIKAAYKGYYTRHIVKKLLDQTITPCDVLAMISSNSRSITGSQESMKETISSSVSMESLSKSSSNASRVQFMSNYEIITEPEGICGNPHVLNKFTVKAILNDILFNVNEIVSSKTQEQ